MARKKRKSLQQMQREKLKRQRSLTKTKPSSLASQRVEKVKVKVEPQKKLPPATSKSALPPGKKGGDIKPKVTPRGRASAKRAQAAAKQVRAAQGTKSTGVKTGQPAGSANRVYGANRVKAAVGRATRAAKLAKVGKALGAAGLIASGVSTAKDLTDSLKRGEGYASLGKLNKELQKNSGGGRSGAKRRQDAKPKKKPKPTKVTSNQPTNRRGRPTTTSTTTKPKPRGMSNIPPGEGTGRGSPNDGPTRTRTPSTPARTPARTPAAPKTPPKKSAAHTYKKHGSDLHIGRHKTLKEHRAAVAKSKKKKKPDSSQVRGMSK
jgi:hypothetical protein